MRLVACRLGMAGALLACSDVAPEAHPSFDGRCATLQEELRIDGYAQDLVPIGTVAVSETGTIALNQVQDGLIRFYAASGELLTSFGSRGEGPGEFMNPLRLGWHADTLWVYDGVVRRVTFISPSFELARTVSNIPGGVRPAEEDVGRLPDFPFASVQAVGRDGSLYANFGLAVNQVVPEPFMGRTTIGRMDPDGIIRDVVLLLPPSQGGSVTSPEGGSASIPFGNSPQYHILPQAGRTAVAMASLEGTEAGTFSLATMDMDGDTLFRRRYRFAADPIPRAVGDSALQARIERLQDFSPSLADAARREGRVPPLYPPINNLLVGNDGSVWIEQRERDGLRAYYVVTSGGDPMGTVFLEQGSRIGAAVLERIWVLEPDEFGVHSLVRYAVGWD